MAAKRRKIRKSKNNVKEKAEEMNKLAAKRRKKGFDF